MTARGAVRAATGPSPQRGRIHQKRKTVNAVFLFCLFPGSVLSFAMTNKESSHGEIRVGFSHKRHTKKPFSWRTVSGYNFPDHPPHLMAQGVADVSADASVEQSHKSGSAMRSSATGNSILNSRMSVKIGKVDSNRSSSVLIRRRNELHIRSEFSIIKVLEDPDKSGLIGDEHDVGITESEIFRTKGTSSGFGMV